MVIKTYGGPEPTRQMISKARHEANVFREGWERSVTKRMMNIPMLVFFRPCVWVCKNEITIYNTMVWYIPTLHCKMGILNINVVYHGILWCINHIMVYTDMAMGQNPGTLVTTQKASKKDYLWVVTNPKKVPWVLTHSHMMVKMKDAEASLHSRSVAIWGLVTSSRIAVIGTPRRSLRRRVGWDGMGGLVDVTITEFNNV